MLVYHQSIVSAAVADHQRELERSARQAKLVRLARAARRERLARRTPAIRPAPAAVRPHGSGTGARAA
jgi:hypothetical protein